MKPVLARVKMATGRLGGPGLRSALAPVVRTILPPGEPSGRHSGRVTARRFPTGPRRSSCPHQPLKSGGRASYRGSVIARVLPEHRRRGVGTALLLRLADHVASLGLPRLRAGTDDDGSLAFAHRLARIHRVAR